MFFRFFQGYFIPRPLFGVCSNPITPLAYWLPIFTILRYDYASWSLRIFDQMQLDSIPTSLQSKSLRVRQCVLRTAKHLLELLVSFSGNEALSLAVPDGCEVKERKHGEFGGCGVQLSRISLCSILVSDKLEEGPIDE